MGILGLIPFLSNLHKKVHISKYQGTCAAVDTSCWLHRGAFACAFELATGKETRKYVNYVVRRIKMLQFNKIYPIMVFDGCNAPSKKNINEKRKQNRQANKEKGRQLLAEGRKSEASEMFQKSISITQEMVNEVIKECYAMNVPVIVAPFEADAQLAHLVNLEIADLVITEDSDLLAFGCKKVLFKLDDNGDGTEIDLSEMGSTTEEPRFDGWTRDKFRQMCIISGCDYLDRLPKCGLKTVHKQFRKFTNLDRGIKAFISNHNMKNVGSIDTKVYYQQFQEADSSFKHHLVFDPISESVQPLTPLPSHLELADMPFLGQAKSPNTAAQIACGNINPHSGDTVAAFVPQHLQLQRNCTAWRESGGKNESVSKLSALTFKRAAPVENWPQPPRQPQEHWPQPPRQPQEHCPTEAFKRSRLEPVVRKMSDDNGDEKIFKIYGTGKRRKVLPQTTAQQSRFFVTSPPASDNPFLKQSEAQTPSQHHITTFLTELSSPPREKENTTPVPFISVFSQPSHRVSHSSAIGFEKTLSACLERTDKLSKIPTPTKDHPIKCGLSKSKQPMKFDFDFKSSNEVVRTKPIDASCTKSPWISTQGPIKPKVHKVGLSKPKVQPKLSVFFSPKDKPESTKSKYF